MIVLYKNGTERTVDNPADFPDSGQLLQKVDQVLEPMILATIVAPDEYTGAIINHCTVRLFLLSYFEVASSIRARSVSEISNRLIEEFNYLILTCLLQLSHNHQKQESHFFIRFHFLLLLPTFTRLSNLLLLDSLRLIMKKHLTKRVI